MRHLAFSRAAAAAVTVGLAAARASDPADELLLAKAQGGDSEAGNGKFNFKDELAEVFGVGKEAEEGAVEDASEPAPAGAAGQSAEAAPAAVWSSGAGTTAPSAQAAAGAGAGGGPRRETFGAAAKAWDGTLESSCAELANFTRTMKSPVQQYVGHMNESLGKSEYQALLSLFAAAVGAVCLWNGPRVWQALFTSAVAAAAACVASYEAKQMDLAIASQSVLVLEIAGVTAWATWAGFEGTQVVLGSILGSASAYSFGAWARMVEGEIPGFAFTWYAIGALSGIMVVTSWRNFVLVVVSPLLGGFFVTAGAGVLLSRGLANFTDHGDLALLPPAKLAASDASSALLGGDPLSSLAGHGLCICLSVLLQASRRSANRSAAVTCLVSGIVLTGGAALFGQECEHLTGEVQCPDWLMGRKGAQWEWTAFGCTAWALTTAASAWRQIGLLQDWEQRQLLSDGFVESSGRSPCEARHEREPRSLSAYISNPNAYSAPYGSSPNQPYSGLPLLSSDHAQYKGKSLGTHQRIASMDTVMATP